MGKQVSIFALALLFVGYISSCNSGSNNANNDPLYGDTTLSLAVQEWSKRIAKYPENDEYRYGRGMELAKDKRFTLAIPDFDKAVELKPNESKYYLARAENYMGLNETKKALADYEKAVEVDSKNEKALTSLGQFYLFVRQFENSLNVFKKLEKEFPSNADGHFYQGMVQKEMGDTAAAIKSFENAVQIDLNHYNAHIQLGHMYSEQNDELGLTYFKKAIDADEYSDEAHYGLGLLYQRLGELDSAIVNYQRTIDINARHYFAYYNTGYIMFSQNNWDRAIEHFRIAIKFAPDFAKGHYMLGLSNEGKDNFDQAKVHYERCLQVDPNFELAKERLNALNM